MMVEPLPAPLEDDLVVSGARVTRQHLIVLCCAHSVVALVEEVARNLEGLGFPVEVVCGAEARSALLGRPQDNAPTIYVVCVQGTLKEQVLRPLRQALAAHGGPNQHLFVAVLDLALPLAMVGQIRRFAEALERPGRKGRDGLGERRMWREHLGPHTVERVPTRSYRALEVAERMSPPTASPSEGPRRTGPQTVIGTGRPAKVGVTAKYRAITGQLPTTDDAEPPGAPRTKRKTRAPKVKAKPVGRRGRKTPASVPEPAAAEAKSTVLVTDVPAVDALQVASPLPVPNRDLASTPPRAPEAEAEELVATRRRWPLVVGALAIAGGVVAWQLGWFTSSPAGPTTVAADAATKPSTPSPVPAAVAQPEPAEVAKPAEVAPADVASPPAIATPDAATPDVARPAVAPSVVATPVESPRDDVPGLEADKPTSVSQTAALKKALARRRLHETVSMYVSTTLANAVSWSTARRLCEDLEVEGVGGFRLPYRRELVGVDVAGYLGSGPHWSRTVADDDVHSAYVLHPSTGELSIWLKAEAASVVCIRRKT
jgi:hypothetical protein